MNHHSARALWQRVFARGLVRQAAPSRAAANSNSPSAQQGGPKQWSHRFFQHPPYQRLAVEALDQQLWCWGRDIQHPKGNLLLELGFSRSRTQGKSTCYHSEAFDGGYVALWGFGVLYRFPALGSVFLGRYQFAPVYLPDAQGQFEPDGHFLVRFQPAHDSRSAESVRGLVSRFCQWVARYEHWLLEKEGVRYRQTCLEERPKKSTLAPGETPGHWELLAKKARDQQPFQVLTKKWGRHLEPVKQAQHRTLLASQSVLGWGLGSPQSHSPRSVRFAHK